MNQELLAKLKNSPQLPSLPAIAVKVLELARQDNTDISEIAKLISNDPALSTKILKTVNSSFYGLPKQVSTISHALVILGLQSVKTLALGFSLLGNLKSGSDDFDYVLFWKRSIYSAVAGRLVAKRAGIVQQEEAFLCCLLADIGMLVMHRVLGAEFDAICKQAGGDQEKQLELCQAKFGLTHAEVGAALTEHWQLPPVLIKPIQQHHQPVEQDPQLRPLVDAVYIAMICGEIFSNASPAPYLVRARRELAGKFKFSADQIENLLKEIDHDTREVAQLLEVSLEKDRSYQEVLDEANETLVQLSLQTQKQAQDIKKENDHLQEVAATDALTCIANRARFASFLEEQFARAFKFQRPLSLLFMDIDHFKKVNDTFGHQAGDEVLRRLGKLLKLAVRNIDLAARYGGEEFAVVLTETDSAAAAQLAESIRLAIQGERIVFDEKVIPVTASIGVAGTDRQRIFTTAQQLIKAADRAVYAAKESGRNCVRLFRPKIADSTAAPSPPAPAAARV